jgi:hypothetical protein
VQRRYRIAEAVVATPDGTLRHVLVPCVNEAPVHALVAEATASPPQYRRW